MKTLKFRFYDKTEKKMRYFDSIWNMPQPDYDFDEIQQFTGLLDKQGKEIYEGDVVMWSDVEGSDFPDSNIQLVKFVNFKIYPLVSAPCSKCWEVIGNIYENPELLKKTK